MPLENGFKLSRATPLGPLRRFLLKPDGTNNRSLHAIWRQSTPLSKVWPSETLFRKVEVHRAPLASAFMDLWSQTHTAREPHSTVRKAGAWAYIAAWHLNRTPTGSRCQTRRGAKLDHPPVLHSQQPFATQCFLKKWEGPCCFKVAYAFQKMKNKTEICYSSDGAVAAGPRLCILGSGS